MLGLIKLSPVTALINFPSNPQIVPRKNPNLPSLLHSASVTKLKRRTNSRQFRVIRAQNDDENGDKLPSTTDNAGDEGEGVRNGSPRLNIRWVDLIFDRDPDNLVAVGLTGLLTWASVQVLWQLFVISVAILIAALKYTIVAALLIFILITLL